MGLQCELKGTFGTNMALKVPFGSPRVTGMNGEPNEVRQPAKDPMKAFRGVVAGTLICEAITLLLALPVVAKLGGGFVSVTGIGSLVVAVALMAACGVLRRPWSTAAIFGLQAVLIVFFVVSVPIGIIGVVFGFVWALLFKWRYDVAKRMAEGTLPSQQT